MNPLTREIIDKTTKKFADDPEVVNRLLWWLGNGHSCERWFQFEWAYKLESVLESRYQSTYSVGCERDRIDVVIYQQTFKPERPLYEQEIFAGIELKWCGNWSAANSIAETRKDIGNMRKGTKYKCPVLALSVWLLVTPSEDNGPLYSWIAKQIKKERINREALIQIITDLQSDFQTEPYAVNCPSNLGRLEVFCIGTYNDMAKNQVTSPGEEQCNS